MEKNTYKRIFILIIAMIMIVIPFVSASNVITVQVKGYYNYDYANEVLKLVNQERAKVGAAPLTLDKNLMDGAMLRAAENSLLSDHVRPNGESFYTVVTKAKANAENIAAGPNAPYGVVKGWMESAGHKKNILNKDYKSIGIGCFISNGNYYWVQLFSRDSVTEKSTYSGVTDKAYTNVSITKNLITSLKLSGLKTDMELAVKGTIAVKKATIQNAADDWSANTEISPAMVSYSSSNTRVFTVDENGVLTGVGPGSAVLTASFGDTTLKYNVKVTNPLVSISLPKEETIFRGMSKKLDVTYIAAETSADTSDDKTVIWESKNTNIATVEQDGTVIAKQTGFAEIVAKVGNLTATCKVTVKIGEESLTLDKTSITAYKNQTIAPIGVTYVPGTSTDYTITWSSNNIGVATVDTNGTIHAKAVGTAKVKASVRTGKYAVCTVEVLDGIKGDVNGDGAVNATDAALVLDYFKNGDATDEILKIADIDENGALNATDAACIIDIFTNN